MEASDGQPDQSGPVPIAVLFLLGSSVREVHMHMRDLALFVAGLVAGTFLMPSSAAQTNTNPGLRLNHVGIAVTDFQKSLDFYTKVMGFRVAFKFPGPEGKPTTTFLQLNRDTFIEMAPASANLPAGITHIGIESADEKTTILQLRQAGATVQDARVSAQTKRCCRM